MILSQIAHFPTPFPGEDFRSVLYRYHLYSLNPEITDTNQELFGTRSSFTVFPRGLEILLCKFRDPQVLSSSAVVEDHSLLPLLLPFLVEERIADIDHEVKHGGGISESYVGKLAGNKYGKCISDDIRYCPCCAHEDMSRYGCSYIHREHQVAFISTCIVHNVKLVSRCTCCNDNLMYWPITGKCKNGHYIASYLAREENNTLDMELYSDLQYLLVNYKGIKNTLIKQRFLEYLHSKGYLDQSGTRIKRGKLLNDILKQFPREVLRMFGLSEKHVVQRNTFERIFWDAPLVINLPLNFLIIRFLAGSIKSFIEVGIPYTCEIPFIDGPWRCENKHCPSFQELSIQRCIRVDNGYRGVSGRFRCVVCQGEYTMEWRWKQGLIKTNYKIIFFSEEKDQQVIEMLNSGVSPDDISSKLFCSPDYVKTLAKKEMERSQLTLFGFDEIAATVEEEVENPKKRQYRDKLLKVISENPGLRRYKICLKCKTQYEWLKRNDRDWLEQQLPSSRSFDRFDWNEVDEALSLKVKEVANQLIASNPNIRVGRYSIMGALTLNESGRIKNYIKHLPKTDHALRECAETKEQYQIRHLPALVWQLRNHYDYKEITLETVLSYRRSYRGISNNMKEILMEKLKTL